MVRRPPYKDRTIIWRAKELIAKGTREHPIAVFSDNHNPTMYDYFQWGWENGLVEYTIAEDSNLTDSWTSNTLTARSKFHNHLESGRNGAGYVIANYFGDCWNECVAIFPNQLSTISFNVFNNPLNNAIGIGSSQRVEITYNCISKGAICVGPDRTQSGTLIIHDNILDSLENIGSPIPINAQQNYWQTVLPTQVASRVLLENQSAAPIDYSNWLTAPPSIPGLKR